MSDKSFWAKREGTTGLILLGGLAVGGFFLVGSFGLFIAPILTAIMGNLILMGLTGGALFGLVMFFLNGGVQQMISQGFQGLCRGLTNIFVDVYHIDILKNRVAELYKKLGTIKEIRESVGNTLKTTSRSIMGTKAEFEKAKVEFKRAAERNSPTEKMVASRQMQRMEKLYLKQVESEKRLKFFVKMLDKYVDMTSAFAQDTKNEVDFVVRDYETTQQVRSAMNQVKKIFIGDKNKEMFDKALEVTLEKTEQGMGEIDNVIEMTSSMVEKFDMENGEFEQKAMEMFDKWSSKSESVLLGDGKRLLIDEAKGLSIAHEVPDLTGEPKVEEGKKTVKSSSQGFDSLYNS